MNKILFLMILAFSVISCGGGSSSSGIPLPDTAGEDSTAGNEIQIAFTFDNDADTWEAGFADYPASDEALYALASGFAALPVPLQNQFGLNVSGDNRSDDLFMFIKKRFVGFEADTQYQLQFEITFATNAPAGCIGVGGAPGEGVTLKASATAIEPLSFNNGNGFYVMNIDKGNQRVGGDDAVSIGDFANTKDCADKDFSYELKTLASGKNALSVFSGSDGELWLLFATDSGFEAGTSIFFVSGKLVATRF